jgi:hypothetical protein
MLNFKKPKKKLGLFLKDNKNSFAKSKLAKIGLATGAAIMSMNLMCDNAVLAQHNNLDNMTAAWQRVPGTFCYALVSTHINHNQHSSHSSHSCY